MTTQRTLPLGRWLTQQTPAVKQKAPDLNNKPRRQHAGLVLELALLLILALLLPRSKKRK